MTFCFSPPRRPSATDKRSLYITYTYHATILRLSTPPGIGLCARLSITRDNYVHLFLSIHQVILMAKFVNYCDFLSPNQFRLCCSFISAQRVCDACDSSSQAQDSTTIRSGNSIHVLFIRAAAKNDHFFHVPCQPDILFRLFGYDLGLLLKLFQRKNSLCHWLYDFECYKFGVYSKDIT